jgi:hypothetical protein
MGTARELDTTDLPDHLIEDPDRRCRLGSGRHFRIGGNHRKCGHVVLPPRNGNESRFE